MRVLVVGEFDPCGFAESYRSALAMVGVDLRIAVQRVYRRDCEPNWWLDSTECDHGELYEFARSADVLILCPCIGQPWSYTAPLIFRQGREPDETHMGGIDWDSLPGAKVALFHGSLLLSAHAEVYADLYRARGYAIAATTLDYVLRMRARYFPPAVFLPDDRARPRQDGEGLHIIHSPTAASLCSTGEWERVAVNAGLRRSGATIPDAHGYVIVQGIEHASLLLEKCCYNAGYDHVRGAFSINSVENAGLGLVNLVGVKADCREWMRANMGHGLPWPDIETMGDVAEWIDRLAERPALTRKLQADARQWYDEHFSPEHVARWTARQLEEIAK